MDHKVTPWQMSVGEVRMVGRLRWLRDFLEGRPVSEDTEMMIWHPAEWRWQKMYEARKKS